MSPQVSVLMPTFDGAAFIERALEGLVAQTLADWELLLVDDGSRDATLMLVEPSLEDERTSLIRLPENRGLGAALNVALDQARAPLIAYLPSDDVLYRNHLASLAAVLEANPDAVLAFSGARHHGSSYADGLIPDFPLQLAQVLHRRTPDRWLERRELVTDDLERMFWSKLRARGAFVDSSEITCEWVEHPRQRHKVIRESCTGGLSPYRARYGVREPLRFQSSEGQLVDEAALYAPFREGPSPPPAADGLTILVVGELSYNPERLLALEERGHRLLGLWLEDGWGYNTVGPLPFGRIEDIPRKGWRDAVQKHQPDLVYALLNWQAVPLAHDVLAARLEVPFVWHFKESPFACLERGTWPQLVDLYTRSHGQIFISPEQRDWYETILPGRLERERTLVLDGDLPKREWFAGAPQQLLSAADGDPHTVVVGRPFGIHPDIVGGLAAHGIHTHFYGTYWGEWWAGWIEAATRLAGDRLHLHPPVQQPRWVTELSRYDAGWLHIYRSRNAGELRRASWDDLNLPARIGTLAAAGLPLLQPDHGSSIVATRSLCRSLDIGIEFRNLEQLAERLRDRAGLARVRENVWKHRHEFTFDHHADRLCAFFRETIERARQPAAAG